MRFRGVRAPVILVLHNRYRTTGGEERAVADLLWLVRERLGEDAELLERDSAALGRGRAAAGMLRGGLAPEEVAAAVRRTGARIVHAHNVNPAFGWRARAAARAAGARVVMHLHNYRLVCAVGTCFTRGADCTRCRGRNTLPGAALACRGDHAEAAVYAAGLALWQRRLAACVDVFAVPSAAALERLEVLGAPLDDRAVVVPHVVRTFAERSHAAEGAHALVASRLAPEKGIEVAIEACAAADVPLVVAGDGPEAAALRERAARAGGEVGFTGRLDALPLAELRAGAGLAVVPSRSAETFGLAAAEAMAAGVPVVASRVGALPELVEDDALVPAGDVGALAGAVRRSFGDAAAGERGLARARALAGPDAAAAALRAAYDAALARRP
jgi:glycosyltransferase involved in cell wall biosynthesis